MELIKRILVPVDLGELSDTALQKSVEFSEELGGEIIALHVYEYSLWGIDGGPESSLGSAQRMRGDAQEAMTTLLRKYRARGIEIAGVLREGIAWSETLNFARECQADLIVMATHERHGLPRTLVGGVAEKVLRHSTIPVLTVHPPTAMELAAQTNVTPTRAAAGRPH